MITSKQLPLIHHFVEAHATRMPNANAIVDSDGSVYSYAQYQVAISDANRGDWPHAG